MYMYKNTASLAQNQKMSWMRSRTGGTSSTSPTNPSAHANAPSPIVWILKIGCFGILIVPQKAKNASRKKTPAGTSENAKSTAPSSGCSQKTGIVIDGPCQLGNGRIQPPSQSVVAIAETAIIAAYSPRMNRDQRTPLYSVWNPATSSDSASGRSNGVRLVSATIATAKMKNATSPSGNHLKTNHT